MPLPVPALCTVSVKTSEFCVAVLFDGTRSGSAAVTFVVFVTVPSWAFVPTVTEIFTATSYPDASEPMAQVTIPLE